MKTVRSEAQNRRNRRRHRKTCRYCHCEVFTKGKWVTAAAFQVLLLQDMCPESLLHIVIEIRFFEQGDLLMQRCHFFCRKITAHCKLLFCCRVSPPKIAGLQHQGHIAGKGQHYCSPKNGLSGANYLATMSCQIETIVWQNCHSVRPSLEKVVAAGSDCSD